jgi:hypothetical protein
MNGDGQLQGLGNEADRVEDNPQDHRRQVLHHRLGLLELRVAVVADHLRPLRQLGRDDPGGLVSTSRMTDPDRSVAAASVPATGSVRSDTTKKPSMVGDGANDPKTTRPFRLARLLSSHDNGET